MQLRLRAQEIPLDTRAAIERRLRLNLGHHSTAIDRAQVSVAENPDANPKHRCRIRVRLRYGQKFTVEGHGEDPLIAAGAAAWRLDNRMNRLRAASGASFPPRRRAGTRREFQ